MLILRQNLYFIQIYIVTIQILLICIKVIYWSIKPVKQSETIKMIINAG